VGHGRLAEGKIGGSNNDRTASPNSTTKPGNPLVRSNEDKLVKHQVKKLEAKVENQNVSLKEKDKEAKELKENCVRFFLTWQQLMNCLYPCCR